MNYDDIHFYFPISLNVKQARGNYGIILHCANTDVKKWMTNVHVQKNKVHVETNFGHSHIY